MQDSIGNDTPLADLKIMALDCQATGANPSKGHLLEIGWMQSGASAQSLQGNPTLQSYLIRLPPNADIPPAVQRITGISKSTLKAAVPSKRAWKYLLATANQIVSSHSQGFCPLVIHFARFELPFLRELHHNYGPAGPFPFQIICTHEITMRLLPNLPRRGIRAIAGYYGYRMPELKRAADHAVATVFIWQHLVQLLNKTCGITNLNQLIDWLSATRPSVRSKRVFPLDPQIRQHLPNQPGIYRMSSVNGDILYIGKAKSLKLRVNSYFRRKASHAEHILEMLTQAQKLTTTVTGSALEAAVLESDDIKRHSPPYNVALRRKNRRLTFCTRDLGRQSNKAHREFPVGPLPTGKMVEAMAALAWWLKNGKGYFSEKDIGMGHAVLGISGEYAPQIECLKKGFAIFRERHRNRIQRQAPLGFLTALGAKLWQEKLAADTAPVDGSSTQNNLADPDESSSESDELPTWTPDAVAGAIEAIIRRSAHSIRRARWFCLLSESSLVWDPAAKAEPNKHLLILTKGAVVKHGVQRATVKTKPPTGYKISFRERQNNIDLVTYDRLRVITTEIRRLLSEEREIELRLGPKVTLGNSGLTKALRWV